MQSTIGLWVIFILLRVSTLAYRLGQDGPCLYSATGASDECSATLPKVPYCGCCVTDRLRGGSYAEVDEYPWTALIQYRKPNGQTGFHCGGTLINSRYVLTAAHCVQARPPGWEVIGVRLGEWDLNSEQDCEFHGDYCADPPVDLGIEKIIVHEDYSAQNKSQYNDIALIRLNRSVVRSGFVAPVCLPTEELPNSQGSVVRGQAAGWGTTENGTANNMKLRSFMDIIDSNTCTQTYSPAGVTLEDTQLCAKRSNDRETCTIDSGGALTMGRFVNRTYNLYLYGIASFGPDKCGTSKQPGVYTNVVKYIDWIERNIE